MTRCEKCGGQMQRTITSEAYYSLENGVWVKKDWDVTEDRVYCENDHKVKDPAALLALPMQKEDTAK